MQEPVRLVPNRGWYYAQAGRRRAVMESRSKFDPHKFQELIVYIARRLGPEASLGHVKLAKLLMHSDFTAFARLGQPVTGATYEKWEHGHFPRELTLALRDLAAAGEVVEEVIDYYGHPLHQLTAMRDPDMSRFSEDEIAAAEGAIRLYGHESAKYLSQLSHLEIGWRLTDWKEVIPYGTVFLGVGGVTESDIRRGEELASLHGWN